MNRIYGFNFFVELISAIFWSCWSVSLINAGFSIRDTAVVLAGLYLSQSIFEVPTGALADFYGRKKCTVAGLLVCALGSGLVVYANSIGLIALAFFVFGFGLTLVSGARLAWLFGLACSIDRSIADKGQRFFLNMNLVGRIATIIGAFGGVKLLEIAPKGIWLSTVGISIAVAASSYWVGEDSGVVLKGKKFNPREILLSASTPLMLAILSGMFFGMEAGVRNLINQPYVLEISRGDSAYLAYFQGILATVRLIGILFYRSISEKFGYRTALILPLICFAVAELFSSYVKSFWSFIPIYAAAVFTLGWFFPLRDSFINSIVPERFRATLLSCDSMITSLGSALTLYFLARVLSPGTVAPLWRIGSAALGASAICLFLSCRFRRLAMADS